VIAAPSSVAVTAWSRLVDLVLGFRFLTVSSSAESRESASSGIIWFREEYDGPGMRERRVSMMANTSS
jgi:hypothetical protein